MNRHWEVQHGSLNSEKSGHVYLRKKTATWNMSRLRKLAIENVKCRSYHCFLLSMDCYLQDSPLTKSYIRQKLQVLGFPLLQIFPHVLMLEFPAQHISNTFFSKVLNCFQALLKKSNSLTYPFASKNKMLWVSEF